MKTKTLVSLILLFGIMGGTVYYLLKQYNFFSSKEPAAFDSKENPPIQVVPTPDKKPISPPISQIISTDDIWNMYQNNEFGYSIKFPKQAAFASGGCTPEGAPLPGFLPVKIFEEKNIAHIASASYFDQECNETSTTLEDIKDRNFKVSVWSLESKKVADDAELQNFVRDEYGNGCILGDKKETSAEGVFDVHAKYPGDVNDDMEVRAQNECVINYAYVIKYNQNTGVAVSWKLGQAYGFAATTDYQKAYDQEMVASFKFD
ncbi:hypothetical protein A3K34_04765 [candidate division WWE3 bacterium RIFOXYC1_FULL_40_10]|uniref:Uncharacterized protein n=1 Tax=candidate division WWE3 bacterium RIFOXYA2_FULL_46_9 TaxID=1802636 RepID=A0A1F4W281_UNCKA|nr:MAG: hypothetical protein A3K58_04765 [candidate division WWE3 bacterium RIFOXYB1_FULL_40_22]OGC62150.1 MAG: hypothetical protein A3K37_04765 [candidate division WWE3 bacterium RIFOXYA1_FULL_40_11]OGC63163.1 MAG: hypothetical protein A2264_00510 [candidate division WWE3 bacterium RIFOXYA2_FULL_46_9]OGC65243.1 MAG: hypothetical protein A2326_04145 [candidate division WWE3 bacterium RIFOXYB2_FULL_41_6]OGC66533.1 MAG: hypothetical protein A3K34_04765 [candidate division WWE3 bacterium RIFOXYC1_